MIICCLGLCIGVDIATTVWVLGFALVLVLILALGIGMCFIGFGGPKKALSDPRGPGESGSGVCGYWEVQKKSTLLSKRCCV